MMAKGAALVEEERGKTLLERRGGGKSLSIRGKKENARTFSRAERKRGRWGSFRTKGGRGGIWGRGEKNMANFLREKKTPHSQKSRVESITEKKRKRMRAPWNLNQKGEKNGQY